MSPDIGRSGPLNILTWHIHGNYLFYLAQSQHHFYLPVRPGRPEGFSGRSGYFPWPDNVHEVPAEDVCRLTLDCVLFQSRKNYLEDQYEVLSRTQQRLPRIYLEHDPPREHPTDTRHTVDDPEVLLVHVTPFNDLMWDSGRTPTMVIKHGVLVPDGVRYIGDLERGIVVVNNIRLRGRRLGADIFERIRSQVPLDLMGMGSREIDGLGDIPYDQIFPMEVHYRFFFHPIRYTSLGLAACEAMMLGMPIIGLATAEMAKTVEHGVSGYIDTDAGALVSHMQELLRDPLRAKRLGDGARCYAAENFNIQRFIRDWDSAFSLVTGKSRPAESSATPRTGTLGEVA